MEYRYEISSSRVNKIIFFLPREEYIYRIVPWKYRYLTMASPSECGEDLQCRIPEIPASNRQKNAIIQKYEAENKQNSW